MIGRKGGEVRGDWAALRRTKLREARTGDRAEGRLVVDLVDGLDQVDLVDLVGLGGSSGGSSGSFAGSWSLSASIRVHFTPENFGAAVRSLFLSSRLFASIRESGFDVRGK